VKDAPHPAALKSSPASKTTRSRFGASAPVLLGASLINLLINVVILMVQIGLE